MKKGLKHEMYLMEFEVKNLFKRVGKYQIIFLSDIEFWLLNVVSFTQCPFYILI